MLRNVASLSRTVSCFCLLVASAQAFLLQFSASPFGRTKALVSDESGFLPRAHLTR